MYPSFCKGIYAGGGYSTQGIGENATAMAYRDGLKAEQTAVTQPGLNGPWGRNWMWFGI